MQNFFIVRVTEHGTGCPGRLRSLFLCRYSKPAWMHATCSGCPCRGLDQMAPSNLGHSVAEIRIPNNTYPQICCVGLFVAKSRFLILSYLRHEKQRLDTAVSITPLHNTVPK